MNDLFLQNGARTNIADGIRDLVVADGGLDLAVSYMQVSGWNALSGIIPVLAPNRVRILLTDQFDITHPEAIKSALERGVQLRRYVGSRIYHPKVYLGRRPQNGFTTAVVGSANLSESGLKKGVEAAIVVRDADVLTRIGHWFDQLWNAAGDASDVDAAFVRSYRSRWRTAARARVKLRSAAFGFARVSANSLQGPQRASVARLGERS